MAQHQDKETYAIYLHDVDNKRDVLVADENLEGKGNNTNLGLFEFLSDNLTFEALNAGSKYIVGSFNIGYCDWEVRDLFF